MFVLQKREQLEKGSRKAREVCPAVRVIEAGVYGVEGSHGNEYYIQIEQGVGGVQISCECLAGQNDKPCYHAAAAYERHIRLAAEAPARDLRLSILAHDLTFISRRAAALSTDFEIGDEIAMAVRSALQTLHEYELSLRPVRASEAA